jgi:hypothetical protein
MKRSIAIICLMLSTASWAASWKKESQSILNEYAYACQNTEVRVENIVMNDHISGAVVGLPTEALDKFKVVFYVKTNRWYVHPFQHYQGQQEGYSYARLNSKGQFKIKTVRRQVPAKQLAAVLLPMPAKISPQKWWLNPILGVFGGVLKYQCAHTLVDGNGDFFN